MEEIKVHPRVKATTDPELFVPDGGPINHYNYLVAKRNAKVKIGERLTYHN